MAVMHKSGAARNLTPVLGVVDALTVTPLCPCTHDYEDDEEYKLKHENEINNFFFSTYSYSICLLIICGKSLKKNQIRSTNPPL